MLYDILTYTCESSERLAAELEHFETLIRKSGTTRFQVIDLLNHTGLIISQFQTQEDFMRGRAINAEIAQQLIEAKAMDSITVQHHIGRSLYSLTV